MYRPCTPRKKLKDAKEVDRETALLLDTSKQAQLSDLHQLAEQFVHSVFNEVISKHH
jgi:hypothetical protein